MAKNLSKSGMAQAAKSARPAAAPWKLPEQAQRDFPDRIQPALELSELSRVSTAIKQLSELNQTGEVMKAIAAQQAAIKQLSELNQTGEVMKSIAAQQAAIKQLSELNKTGEVMKAISAQQKMAEQLRASLQLPHLEALTKQATEAAAAVSKRFAGLTSARDIVRAAASTIPASAEHRSALPSLSMDRLSDSRVVAITSARDLGQLVREARQQRSLSQQAFADLVGVGRRFISELENGKATLEFDKVLQVASTSGIDVLARRRR